MHIEGKLGEGPGIQGKEQDENETKQNRTKQNKEHEDVTSEKGSMTSEKAKQKKEKKLPHDDTRIDSSTLALGYPLLGPSRHVWAYTRS